MAAISTAEALFKKSIALAAGLQDGMKALTGIEPPPMENRTAGRIYNILTAAAQGSPPHIDEDESTLEEAYNTARRVFIDHYSRHPWKAEDYLDRISGAENRESAAAAVASLWAPELGMEDDEIIRRWRLADVKPNPRPIQPEEVVLQLNALYTLPEAGDNHVPGIFREAWEDIRRNPGESIADYDHPVPLFETDSHELIDCLDELEQDILFEKKKGVLSPNFRVPVLVSVSVTHPSIDELTGRWVQSLIGDRHYENLEVIILTEHRARRLGASLFGEDIPLFTVLGAYGAHFNALKYAQLILEASHGVRAGFKLDTDEGIHSRDLFEATGKTWFETMCHPYWGGTALDWKGRKVTLGINEGEYINSRDIERLGYAGALRCPDVEPPASYAGADLFFAKGFAHGRATALYNRFDRLDDFLSHPVVKGGGYGITNNALREAAPFTLSIVGRAEDQQFYFSALSRGVRGIFHPDLRIAHYKDRVSRSEGKTAATRFGGDMFRLVLFGFLAESMGVKDDIDPMPGVFASPIAPAQSFFHILIRAYRFSVDGKEDQARYLLNDVLSRLRTLRRDMENGTVARLLGEEKAGWREFIRRAADVTPEAAKKALGVG